MVQNDQQGTYHEFSLWNEKQVCGQNALESPNDKEQRIYDSVFVILGVRSHVHASTHAQIVQGVQIIARAKQRICDKTF